MLVQGLSNETWSDLAKPRRMPVDLDIGWYIYASANVTSDEHVGPLDAITLQGDNIPLIPSVALSAPSKALSVIQLQTDSASIRASKMTISGVFTNSPSDLGATFVVPGYFWVNVDFCVDSDAAGARFSQHERIEDDLEFSYDLGKALVKTSILRYYSRAQGGQGFGAKLAALVFANTIADLVSQRFVLRINTLPYSEIPSQVHTTYRFELQLMAVYLSALVSPHFPSSSPGCRNPPSVSNWGHSEAIALLTADDVTETQSLSSEEDSWEAVDS